MLILKFVYFFFALIKFNKWVDTTDSFNKHIVFVFNL